MLGSLYGSMQIRNSRSAAVAKAEALTPYVLTPSPTDALTPLTH